ncbi:MAG: hypothetical protein ACI4KA_03400 [Oscillospiraceae bacterium]
MGGFNTRPSASTAYGALIDRYADDLGIARALCDVAQRLGFDSYVFEGYETDGDKIAWCCVKMDDIWYIVNPYGAKHYVQNCIASVPFGEKEVCHYNFLCLNVGRLDISSIDERQEYLWDGDRVIETEYDLLYYFKDYLKVDYYSESAESAYAALLEKTKEQLDSGSSEVDVYMLSLWVDTLWEMMQESYISDLSEKYGITITDFTGEYAGDALHITLTL